MAIGDTAVPKRLFTVMSSLLLRKSHVRIRDLSEVHAKIAKFVRDGPGNIQVMADFDYTISRTHFNGERCPIVHEVFRYVEKDNLREQYDDLAEVYRPIEISSTLPIADKIPHMITWWKAMHDLIVSKNLTEDDITVAISRSRLRLRDAVDEFFSHLADNNIPIVIFSAAIADVIRMLLSQKLPKLPKDVHIISNNMVFSGEPDNGHRRLIGFRDPVVHIFNKNKDALTEDDRRTLHHLKDLPNVLLLGDGISDISMDCGLISSPTFLRIGFFNKSPNGMIDQFMKEYDIVLIDDQTFNIPNSILLDVISGICDFTD